jgi:hypothetical protein
MPGQICNLGASSWLYYKEICYDAAQAHERKKLKHVLKVTVPQLTPVHVYILLEGPTSTSVSLVLKEKFGQLTGASRTVVNAGVMH